MMCDRAKRDHSLRSKSVKKEQIVQSRLQSSTYIKRERKRKKLIRV